MSRGLDGFRLAMRAWFNRHPLLVRAAECGLHLLLIGGGMVLLLSAPIEVLLIVAKISEHSGEGADAAIRLGFGAKALMAATLGCMAVGSAMVAGFARHSLTTLFTGRWTVLLPVAATFALLLWVSHVFRHAIGLIQAQRGDNWFIVVFLTAWVLLIGYVCKVPWDEARDRWRKVAEGFWKTTNESRQA